MDWDDLRFVLALRRAGSLGAAARLLKVEQSTASSRLTALESALSRKKAARCCWSCTTSVEGAPDGARASGVEAGTLEAFEQLDELLVALGASVGQ